MDVPLLHKEESERKQAQITRTGSEERMRSGREVHRGVGPLSAAAAASLSLWMEAHPLAASRVVISFFTFHWNVRLRTTTQKRQQQRRE